MTNLPATSVIRQLRPCVSRPKSLQPIDLYGHDYPRLSSRGIFFFLSQFSAIRIESDAVFVSQPHHGEPRYRHFRDFVVRDSWFVKVCRSRGTIFLWGFCTGECEIPVQVETSSPPKCGGLREAVGGCQAGTRRKCTGMVLEQGSVDSTYEADCHHIPVK